MEHRISRQHVVDMCRTMLDRVAIHPLVVIIGIASGVVLAGIIGALVAVPLIAVLNTGIRRLARQRPEVPPDAVVVPTGGAPTT